MWELNHNEGWALKNWCFWTVLLEKILESPLDYKEILPVHPKGNQSWIFIGRADAEAETQIFWPPDTKNWLVGKDPDAGKDWRQEEKGTTEDEMVGWHPWLDEHEFEQALGVGNGQGSLVCYSPWGCKESDTTEQINWTELNCLFRAFELRIKKTFTHVWASSIPPTAEKGEGIKTFSGLHPERLKHLHEREATGIQLCHFQEKRQRNMNPQICTNSSPHSQAFTNRSSMGSVPKNP